MTVNHTLYTAFLAAVPADLRWSYAETAREEDGSTAAPAAAAVWAWQNPHLLLALIATAAQKAAVRGAEYAAARKGTAHAEASANRTLTHLRRVGDLAEGLPTYGVWEGLARRIAADAAIASALVEGGKRRRAAEEVRALAAYAAGAADACDFPRP